MNEAVPQDQLATRGFALGEFAVHPSLNRIEGPDGVVRLEPRIMAVLLSLAQRAGSLVTHDELFWEVWGPAGATDEVLSQAISTIRSAFGESSRDAPLIETIPKAGYRLTVQPTRLAPRPDPARQPVSNPRKRRRFQGMVAGGAALLSFGLVALQRVASQRAAPEESAIRFDRPPRLLSTLGGDEVHPALSPDGTRLAYAWRRAPGDPFDLWQLELDGGAPGRASAITTTAAEQEVSPAWSPDGSYLAYLRTRSAGSRCEVVVSSVATHEEATVYRCEGERFERLKWSPSGDFVVLRGRPGPRAANRLFRLEVDRGNPRSPAQQAPQAITSPPLQSLGDDAFVISPDGRTVVFSRLELEGVADLYRLDLRSGAVARLTERRGTIDDLLWADGDAVWAAAGWGPRRGVWRIAADDGATELVTHTESELLDLTGSVAAGLVVYRRLHNDVDLVRVDLDGSSAPRPAIPGSTRVDSKPAIAPRAASTQRRLAFESNRAGPYEIWTSRLDGSETRQITRLGGSYNSHPRWSPSGEEIVFEGRPDGQSDLYVTRADGSQMRRVTEDSAQDVTPSWSADGRWLFFASNPTGQWEVWAASATAGERQQITSAGGMAPQADREGRWLYYAKPYERGLWRRELPPGLRAEALGALPAAAQEGGAGEQQVESTLAVGDYDAWAVTDRGIVLLERLDSGRAQLVLLDPESGASRVLAASRPTPFYSGGIGVSPAGDYALVAVQSRLENDLEAFTVR
jgi:Tol biopolymer transport system component/DNA-binding winged helix-turn-helix (wHTH) protein